MGITIPTKARFMNAGYLMNVGAKSTVKDFTGNPIEDVTVIIEKNGSKPRKKVTEKDGSFDVSLIDAEADKTKISFAKTGYKTVEKGFESEGRKEFDVTLEPEAK